jgi:hypothetical protein
MEFVKDPMGESLGRKHVAELVVELRFADAHYQPNSSAPQESDSPIRVTHNQGRFTILIMALSDLRSHKILSCDIPR